MFNQVIVVCLTQKQIPAADFRPGLRYPPLRVKGRDLAKHEACLLS